jgi:hypothetical protein
MMETTAQIMNDCPLIGIRAGCESTVRTIDLIQISLCRKNPPCLIPTHVEIQPRWEGSSWREQIETTSGQVLPPIIASPQPSSTAVRR